MRTHFLFFLSLLILLLSACGAGTPAATQPPVASVPPAVTITGPTAPAPPPAVTLISPTALPTGEVPLPVSPTAESVLGPETYPADVNPLTGLPADEGQLNHRVLAIKISNFPRYVRPQAGLSQADIVFEHYAEGGTTRFTAIFYGQNADRIGPIRSARLIDTIIPEMFKSALVASGSSNGVLRRLGVKNWFDLVLAETTGYQCPILLCMETDDTNSLFSSTAAIRQVLASKGLDTRQPFRGVSYFSRPPAGGAPVTALRIEYSGAARTEWQYDQAAGRYLRFDDKDDTDMQPHLDAVDNRQLSAANVVVLFVNHVVDFSVPEDFDTDGQTGHFSTEVQLWATGPAWLLRDGQVYEATWVRLKAGDMVGLVDAENHLIPFKPGNTWYQVVGLTSDTITDGPSWLVRHKSPRDRGDIPGAPTLTPTAEGAISTESATPNP